jgi:hypothetical protein
MTRKKSGLNVREVMGEVLSRAEITRHDVAGIGIHKPTRNGNYVEQKNRDSCL